jgi:hypothetical protein
MRDLILLNSERIEDFPPDSRTTYLLLMRDVAMRYILAIVIAAVVGAATFLPSGCRRQTTARQRPQTFDSVASPPTDSARVPGPRELEAYGRWIIEAPDSIAGTGPGLFGARFRTTGELVFLWLDTLTSSPSRTDWLPVDSIQTQLRPGELLAPFCTAGKTPAFGQVVAVVRDTPADLYPRPRLTWLFDLRNLRIRAFATDSVRCAREAEPE